jgi:hypothetical protein
METTFLVAAEAQIILIGLGGNDKVLDFNNEGDIQENITEATHNLPKMYKLEYL